MIFTNFQVVILDIRCDHFPNVIIVHIADTTHLAGSKFPAPVTVNEKEIKAMLSM